MKVLETERLIHEVLDGTADAGMREELERLLQEAIYSVVHAARSGAEGLELEAGSRVVLRQGSMGLDFRTGVRAVLEAPAEAWIRGEERVELVGGSVWFEVPAGREGFEVLSPELRVEDLGTEFGVVVEEGRLDEVHVTKGSVRVWHRAGDPETAGMLVNGRQGLRSTPQRDLERVPFDGGRFATKVRVWFRVKWCLMLVTFESGSGVGVG